MAVRRKRLTDATVARLAPAARLQQNRRSTIMPGVRLTQRRVHALSAEP